MCQILAELPPKGSEGFEALHPGECVKKERLSGHPWCSLQFVECILGYVRDTLDRGSSYGHRLGKDAITHRGIEASLSDNLYSSAEESLEIKNEASRKPRSRFRSHCYQEIYITRCPVLTPHNRSENTNRRYPVPSCQFENTSPLFM